jgi:hypothetical protein
MRGGETNTGDARSSASSHPPAPLDYESPSGARLPRLGLTLASAGLAATAAAAAFALAILVGLIHRWLSD